MDIQQLTKIANAIPSLGGGGRSIGQFLIEAAEILDQNQTIVEVGPWLGSSTAYLSIGTMLSSNHNQIYCYDEWIANEIYRERAKKHHGIEFEENEDLLPYFLKNLEPFGTRPIAYKGDFKKIDKNEIAAPLGIGIAICDAGLDMELNNKFMEYFSSCFVKNALIVFMDYYFCERKDKVFQTQRLMLKKNKSAFSPGNRIGGSYTHATIYKGGKIRPLTEADYETA